jgi:hypothetical protein
MDYVLEIYSPGSRDTVLALLESRSPFMPIHKGDIIQTWGIPDNEGIRTPLVATSIEHAISESKDGYTHQVMVFTEEQR